MPSVIVGSALDIVEHCGVPRYLHVDFPLGNPCGKPWDTDMQSRIMSQALALFESATKGGSTAHSPESWGNHSWREQYMQVSDENRADLARKGEELRARRAVREKRAD